MVYELRREFKLFLSTPGIREKSTTFRKRIGGICLNLYAQMKSRALIGCLKHTQACSVVLQEGDPFEFKNFVVSVTRVPEYARVVQTLGAFWIRIRFKYPLILLLVEEYHSYYHLCDYEEESCL